MTNMVLSSKFVTPLTENIQETHIFNKLDVFTTVYYDAITINLYAVELLSFLCKFHDEYLKVSNELKMNENKLARMVELLKKNDLDQVRNSLDFEEINSMIVKLRDTLKFGIIGDMIEMAPYFFKNFDTFLSDFKKLIDAMKALRETKEFKYIKPIITALKYFQSTNLSKEKLAEHLPKIQENLRNLQEFINNTENFKVFVRYDLSDFGDISEHLMVIGKATRGIVSMMNVMGERDAFDELLASVKSYGKSTEELKALEDQLPKMFKDLGAFENSVRFHYSEKLSEFYKLFEAAAKVSGITFDLQKLKSLPVSQEQTTTMRPETTSEEGQTTRIWRKRKHKGAEGPDVFVRLVDKPKPKPEPKSEPKPKPEPNL